MNYWLLAAAIMSGFTCVIHTTLGGRETAVPLLAAPDLKKIPKYTAYYCWHLVTITLAGIAFAFWLAAGDPNAHALGVFATFGSGAFALWSVVMIAIFKLRPFHFPQWALFIPAAILGVIGLM